MNLDAILGSELLVREAELRTIAGAAEHARAAMAGKLATIARNAAAALAQEVELHEGASAETLERACRALSVLRVEAAKSCLVRIADEGTAVVKSVLASALRETTTPEGRSVLVHLLSDDDARAEAIVAIGAAPWPGVLPLLIEVSESDDQAARLSADVIAKVGATAGPDERFAATDFLLELVEDEATSSAAVGALLRFGSEFPGVTERARTLAKAAGKRRVGGLCLLAAAGEDDASLSELARSGASTGSTASTAKDDPRIAQRFLGPLLEAPEERIRRAAERTWRALDLR